MESINPQIYEAQEVPKRKIKRSSHLDTLEHKTKGREKETRGKKTTNHLKSSNKLTADFSSVEFKRQGNIFMVLKGNKCQPRIWYPAKIYIFGQKLRVCHQQTSTKGNFKRCFLGKKKTVPDGGSKMQKGTENKIMFKMQVNLNKYWLHKAINNTVLTFIINIHNNDSMSWEGKNGGCVLKSLLCTVTG